MTTFGDPENIMNPDAAPGMQPSFEEYTPVTSIGIAPSDILDKLIGLDPWFAAAAAAGNPMTTAKIAKLIVKRTRRWEHLTQYRVNPVQCCADPDGVYAPTDTVNGISLDVPTNTMPVILEAAYPYFPDEARNWFRMTLRNRPVWQIQRWRVNLGNNYTAFAIPNDWIRLEPRSGKLHIQPISGAILGGYDYVAMALLQQMFGFNRTALPQSLAIDYIAGCPVGWQDSTEYSDLFDALCDYIALGVLEQISETFSPGIPQKSISDGKAINQNMRYDRFERRKAELKANSDEFMGITKDQDVPFLFGVL